MPLVDLSELIEMAVKDEETGIVFYKALAEVARNPAVKDGMLAIAAQEQGQLAWFQKMLDDIGQYQPVEEDPGEYEEYLWALLKSRAFPKPEDAAAKAHSAETDAAGIEMAIKLEHDTLEFLEDMRRFVGPERSTYVDVIIEEEREHLVALTRLKETVT